MTYQEMRERRAIIIRTLWNLSRFDLVTPAGRLSLLRELRDLEVKLNIRRVKK